MIQVLVNIKKNIVKILLSLTIIFPVMIVLNTGFPIDTYWKIAQSVIFTVVFTIILVWPQSKKTIFWLGLFLIILMMFFYIFSLIEWSNMIGSTGVGFIMINLVSYLPQLIKLGYIKNL